MKYTLNIGLARKGSSYLDVVEVIRALQDAQLYIGAYALVQSGTEPTVVVEVDGPAPAAGYVLAQRLGQDCIAVWHPDTEVGRLIGPHAAAWGEFNPEFFLLLDGSILSTTVATA